MKLLVKSLLLLAFAAIPFLALTTPAQAEIGISIGGSHHHGHDHGHSHHHRGHHH